MWRTPARWTCVLLMGSWTTVVGFAQEAATPTFSRSDAFSRPAPASLADLQEIESRVTALAPTLRAATVSVRVGGAQGSGVLVSAAGEVLTAAHVVSAPGARVSIVLSDGSRHSARALGRNTALDAALLRIESTRTDFPWRPIATDDPQAGDWCIAMGHPNGYQAERGVVLRLGRVIHRDSWTVQTDCKIVGGDSGGPLFNLQGEVIGINSRIGESTEYNLHVPALVYRRDWERLLAGEDFRTHTGAYLGVAGAPSSDPPGMRITTVIRGGAAERAGVREGDFLLSFQGRDVASQEQLTEMIGEEPPGKSVKLRLRRNDDVLELTARLGFRGD